MKKLIVSRTALKFKRGTAIGAVVLGGISVAFFRIEQPAWGLGSAAVAVVLIGISSKIKYKKTVDAHVDFVQ